MDKKLPENCKLYPKNCKCSKKIDNKCCSGSDCTRPDKCGNGVCNSGNGNSIVSNNKEKCCNYSFVSKNPFDVGISKSFEDDSFFDPDQFKAILIRSGSSE